MRGLAISAGLLALATAGCGGGGGSSERGAPVARQGGEVRFLSGGDVDFVDPGQTYYTFGYLVQYAVNRPLYSFSPEDGGRSRPDLAEGDPQISADQKTVTVRLKAGIRYAPPVERAVAARDVKYAIERAFSANVPNGYAFSYFADMVGAPAAPTEAVEEIRGIEAPDDRTLVIRLERPVAATVSAALVMPITVPVPEERAAAHDRRSPSDYDRYVAFTGPYMIRNDAAGKLVGRDPGGRIELVRNPNWSRAGDYRPAYLDAITIETGNNDLTIAARRALRGDGLMCCDVSPPAAVLREALRDRPGQVGRVPNGGTLDRPQHEAAAVRRPRRPPRRAGGVRPRSAAADAGWPRGGSDRAALHPAGHAGFRGVRRQAGLHRAGLHARPGR